MNITYDMLFSEVKPQSVGGKIVQFPIFRILISIVFLIPPILIHNTIVMLVRDVFEPASYEWFKDVMWIADILLFMLSYYFYTRFVEKRPAYELSKSKAFSETGVGILVGAILVTVVVGIMFLAKCYAIDSFGEWDTLVHLLRQFGAGAFLEELIFRVIVFRLLEEWLGSLSAFIISCLMFSLAHMGNPNATVLTTVTISALSALLTSSFMLTRRIWLVLGLHFGWNYFQTAVFGMANSGRSDHMTLVSPRITGPEWLTGGAFGIEASWLAFALMAITALIMIRMALQRGQIVKPAWQRPDRDVTART